MRPVLVVLRVQDPDRAQVERARARRVTASVGPVSPSTAIVRRVRVPVVRVVMVTPRVGVLVRVVKVMRRAVRVSAANASLTVSAASAILTVSAASASLTVSVRVVRRVRVPVVHVVMVMRRVGVLVRVVMIVVPAVRSAKNVFSVR